MTGMDSGLNTWQLMTNHNKMIELQKKLYDGEALPSDAPTELSFFGSSAEDYFGIFTAPLPLI